MKKFFALILCSLFVYMSFPMQIVMAETQAADVHVEHLLLPKKLAKKSPKNVVNVSSGKIQVLPYNTLELTFAEAFNSKNASVGDNIVFLLNNGLKTEEGTEILPAGTKFVAEITDVQKPKLYKS